MLRIDNLHFARKKVLFQNVNLSFDAPALIGIFGKNGVGKTTFLKLLSGIEPASDNAIFLFEKPVQSLTAAHFSETIFYLESGRNFFSALTVSELFSIGAAAKGWNYAFKNKPLSARTLNLISAFNLHPFFDKKTGELSDGEYQLVSICFALSRPTPLVLLDEPFSFLDKENRELVVQILHEEVTNFNRLILFSSHDYLTFSKCTFLLHFENTTISKVPTNSIFQTEKL